MIFSWWKRRRRRQLAAQPFSDDADATLRRNFALYERLDPGERSRLQDLVKVFKAEKHWEGCGGLAVTDEMRLTISAQACLLVLGFDDEYYDRLLSVLIYPRGYFADERRQLPGGVVAEDVVLRLGEAWHTGPVVLSWEDALDGGRFPGDGRNVVFHEFAHVLDPRGFEGVDFATDGLDEWNDLLETERRRLERELSHGRPALLDAYAATSRAEFFAVATETFFERPLRIRERHPRLFDALTAFYRQDPTRWRP